MVNTILQETNKSTLGIVGLGVMGKSLARNWARAGIQLSLYNRFVKNVEEQIAEKTIQVYPELKNASGFEHLPSFVQSLTKPRIIFMMIKAGKETDLFIDEILPHLDAGDILIDGGNSHYEDTKNVLPIWENNKYILLARAFPVVKKGHFMDQVLCLPVHLKLTKN